MFLQAPFEIYLGRRVIDIISPFVFIYTICWNFRTKKAAAGLAAACQMFKNLQTQRIRHCKSAFSHLIKQIRYGCLQFLLLRDWQCIQQRFCIHQAKRYKF